MHMTAVEERLAKVEADGELDGRYNMGRGPLMLMGAGLDTDDAGMMGKTKIATGYSGRT